MLMMMMMICQEKTHIPLYFRLHSDWMMVVVMMNMMVMVVMTTVVMI